MRLAIYDLPDDDRICLMVNMFQPITLSELNRKLNFDLPDCLWVGMERILEIGKKDFRVAVTGSGNGYVFKINRHPINPIINIKSNVNNLQL